jgi:hypothetical protein
MLKVVAKLLLLVEVSLQSPFVGTWNPVPIEDGASAKASTVRYAAVNRDQGLAFADEKGAVFEAHFDGNVYFGKRDATLGFQLRRISEREYVVFATKDSVLVFTERLIVSEDGQRLKRIVNTFEKEGSVQSRTFDYLRIAEANDKQGWTIPLYGLWQVSTKPEVAGPSPEPIVITEELPGLRLKSSGQELLLRRDGRPVQVTKRTPSAESALNISKPLVDNRNLTFSVSSDGKPFAEATLELDSEGRKLKMTVVNLKEGKTYVQGYERGR